MDALRILEEQHREVERLFAAFFATPIKQASRREELFETLADRLAAHSKIEEEIFYPQVNGDNTEVLVDDFYEAHREVKETLATLMDEDVGAEEFEAQMRDLQRDIDTHVRAEERQLFPRVRRAVPELAREELGERMEELWAETMEQGSPRNEIPAELESQGSHAP